MPLVGQSACAAFLADVLHAYALIAALALGLGVAPAYVWFAPMIANK